MGRRFANRNRDATTHMGVKRARTIDKRLSYDSGRLNGESDKGTFPLLVRSNRAYNDAQRARNSGAIPDELWTLGSRALRASAHRGPAPLIIVEVTSR